MANVSAEEVAPESDPADTPSRGRRKGRASRRSNRVLKIVRRVHMYTGLLMFPWALFFGLSGLLFNHPGLGERVTARPLDATTLTDLTGLEAWDPAAAAAALLDRLNAERPPSGGGAWALDGETEPHFVGPALLKAPAPTGMNMLLLDVERGRGLLTTRHARSTEAPPAFVGDEAILLDDWSVDAVEERVAGLLEARDVAAEGPLRAHPKIGPTLRFRVLDGAGERFNVTWNSRSGEVGGRRTARVSDIGFNQLFGMLHTTHHYPPGGGALWFWALFEDLLGLTMALWAVSGLVMWWQMKSLRLSGFVVVVVALVIVAAVLGGTASQLLFGDVAFKLSP